MTSVGHNSDEEKPLVPFAGKCKRTPYHPEVYAGGPPTSPLEASKVEHRETTGFASAGMAYEPMGAPPFDLGAPTHTSIEECADLLREWGVE